MTNCNIWNVYGPAETTLSSHYHLVDTTRHVTIIPIGKSIANYRCLIVDDFAQPVFVGQEGELVMGGVGVFAGYFGREDLTANALADIDGHTCYRTGDLVRFDNNGLLYYAARKDHQIKLRGQRIELGEIERCLLDTSISACVVMKWGDDHLIAYVQSSDINVEQLRTHCRSRLPPFMVPSMFIVLKQLPLNPNGKVDRKRLPAPDFLTISASTACDRVHAEPNDDVERRIHLLWCEMLQCSGISTHQSIFSVGGHSLLVMQLYHRYKTLFDFDTRALSITQLFQHPSIADHARLIQQAINNELCHDLPWLPLHLTQGKTQHVSHFLTLPLVSL